MTPPKPPASVVEREREENPLAEKHRCCDFDDDCKDVPDGHFRSHLNCWLYQPENGWCPFLRIQGSRT